MSAALSPFDLLLSISRDCASKDSAALVTDQKQWVGVGFTLAGKPYVADMGQVGEVLQPIQLTEIPGVQPWVLGVANVRGQLLPVVDLLGFFDLPKLMDTRRQRIITVQLGDFYVGLLVDAVSGMRYFLDADFVSEGDGDSISNNNIQTYLSGGYRSDAEVWPLFDLHRLLFSDEFQAVAA